MHEHVLVAFKDLDLQLWGIPRIAFAVLPFCEAWSMSSGSLEIMCLLTLAGFFLLFCRETDSDRQPHTQQNQQHAAACSMHAMPFETSLARARHHHRDAREMAVTGLSTGFHAPRHRPGAQCVETAEFLWKPRPHRPVQVGGSSKMEMVTSRRRGTVQGQGPCRTLRLCDYPFTEEFTQLAACADGDCSFLLRMFWHFVRFDSRMYCMYASLYLPRHVCFLRSS